MVDGNIEVDPGATEVHGVDQFTELVQRRGASIELGERGIHIIEIQRRIGAPETPHPGIGRRDGKYRQELYDPETHPAHNVIQFTRQIAKGSRRRDHRVTIIFQLVRGTQPTLVPVPTARGRGKLTDECGVDGVGPARVGGPHFDPCVVPFRPFRVIATIRNKAGLGRKTADIAQRKFKRVLAGIDALHTQIVPVPGQERCALLHVLYQLVTPDFRVSKIGA